MGLFPLVLELFLGCLGGIWLIQMLRKSFGKLGVDLGLEEVQERTAEENESFTTTIK